jgi:uncharacterized protein (TIGR02266 family)
VSAKRRDDRVPARLQVAFRTAGAFLVSYSVNLSRGGIFIETATPLPVGTDLTLQLEVPGAGAFELVGQVAWVRQGSPDGFPDGLGIKLQELDARYGAAIDHLVQAFVGHTVLLLAGSQERIALLARYVRSIISCEILEALSYEEAGAAIAAEPDLVLLDLERASHLSTQTVDRLKADAPGTPVILLAADLRARELGRLAGADEILEAPPSFQALQAAVIRTLSRPAQVTT